MHMGRARLQHSRERDEAEGNEMKDEQKREAD